MVLVEAHDESARRCMEQMTSLGAISCVVYNNGDDRVIYSTEKQDDGSIAHHVSVGRKRKPVHGAVVRDYASLVVPGFAYMKVDSVTVTRQAAHAWYVEDK